MLYMPVPGPLPTVQRAEFWGDPGIAGLLARTFRYR